MGRRIATGAFWVIALYLAAVGFWSIPAQVFQTSPDEALAASSCAEGVESLRAELLGRASERVAAGGTADPHALHRWLDDWDRRHEALGLRCTGPGSEPHAMLGRMRYRIETSLRRYDDGQAPLNRAIDRGLRSLSAQTQQ